ncbi:mediator-associated protein 1-like [Dorcoceras hygrometricum]|uniref:Mediator-associated protein 1-like n=1 Tax=Dorcoceras hygrometricum TaxID=472368 RepID=A0A2Z7A892_9LAMI|nr:mediator-associated protein 1-like [Dorcoceras hygrometricum]
MGNADPNNTKQENKYEVKPHYEELSKQLNMQHAINQCYECMRAIKDRIARPVYHLEIITIEPLYHAQRQQQPAGAFSKEHQNDTVPTNSNDVAVLHQLTTDISSEATKSCRGDVIVTQGVLLVIDLKIEVAAADGYWNQQIGCRRRDVILAADSVCVVLFAADQQARVC